jgi:hypothetical protein
MKETKKCITEALEGLKVDVALIGSLDRDLDIFVVNNENTNSNYLSTKPFLERLQYLKSELDCDIIVKNQHQYLIKKAKKRLVHLLFYPSYKHLHIWELPSFISCVYEKGDFLIGHNRKLRTAYKNYRSRTKQLHFDIFTYNLYKYIDLAVTNLIYLTIGSSIFSERAYFDNLIFIYRYTLREFLMSELNETSPVPFWEWEELLEFIQKKESFGSLYKLLKLKERVQVNISNKGIVLLFLEYLKFCDVGLSDINQLNIGKIIEKI